MTRFLTTTALGAVLLAGAPAFSASDATQLFLTEMTGENMQASEFIGMRVYAAEQGVEGEEIMGLQDGWEDVGEINDIVLTRDGEVEAVIVDFGGFLGLGERQVALKMDSLQLVADSETEEPGDFFVVVPASRAMLEDAPEFSFDAAEAEMEETAAEADAAAEEAEAEVEQAAAETEAAAEEAEADVEQAATEAEAEVEEAANEAENAAEEAGTEVEQAANEAGTEVEQAADEAAEEVAEGAEATERVVEEGTTGLATAVSREGYEMAKIDELTTEDLTGARVYDVNGERIGEIGQLNINDAGEIEVAVVDVGGFLGLGEKPVALDMSELDILRDTGMGALRIEVSKTKEELEAMPAYEE